MDITLHCTLSAVPAWYLRNFYVQPEVMNDLFNCQWLLVEEINIPKSPVLRYLGKIFNCTRKKRTVRNHFSKPPKVSLVYETYF